MNDEPQLHLILELEAEAARWRRRTMFMVSVVLHVVLIALLLIEPQLFRSGARLIGLRLEQPKRDLTFLTLPPDLQKVRPPNTNALSDKNRLAQGRSPLLNPKGLRMPYSRGNTPLPEVAGNKQPPTPPAPTPTPPPAAAPPQAAPPAGGNPGKGADQQTLKAELEKPKLLDIPSSQEGDGSKLRLPLSTPGDVIRQSAQEAARGRAAGGGGAGYGDSAGQFRNFNPNFSTEGPLILSDTRGVDFGPYLARVVYAVRRNWYAVIPESARLGQKGRVAVVFEILKDGSVPELRLVSSSGDEPLDRAALAGIRASTPFPPLPQEFTGNHLVLQFIFLYNEGYSP